MIRKIVLGSFAAAAFSIGGGLAAAPAQADIIPTYTCDNVIPRFEAVGIGDCIPSFNAVPQGAFFGPSLLIARNTGERVFCRGGGFAETPVRVFARACTPA